MKKEYYDKIYQTVFYGKTKEAADVGKWVSEQNISSEELGKVLEDAMGNVGIEYEARRIALPQLIMATYSFKKLIAEVKEEVKEKNTVVMCVVKNDVHDIGKTLVCGMLEVYGYKVYDLGKDVPLDTIVDKVKELKPNILGMSTLLTSTMPELKEVIEKLKKEGLRNKVKVMVGGAPITGKFSKMIGADGYAVDAIKAVKTTDSLIKGETCYLD